MTLTGWTAPLPPELAEGVTNGTLKVVIVNYPKFGDYALLKGKITIGNTTLSF